MPFSDPLADGPVIQRATERALAARQTCAASLELVAAVRAAGRRADRGLQLRQPDAAHGRSTRSRGAAADAGVDGVLALDLPIEEAERVPRRRSRRRASNDLPAEPDDDRRADPTAGGARAAASCTASRGSA